jgi:hypothetical protein
MKVTSLNALTVAGAKIASWYSDNSVTEKASLDKDGVFTAGGYITSGGVVLNRLTMSATAGLATCGVSTVGRIEMVSVAASTVRTKLCLCTSDNAASPAYAWKNISVSGGTEASTIGNTTTCP